MMAISSIYFQNVCHQLDPLTSGLWALPNIRLSLHPSLDLFLPTQLSNQVLQLGQFDSNYLTLVRVGRYPPKRYDDVLYSIP